MSQDDFKYLYVLCCLQSFLRFGRLKISDHADMQKKIARFASGVLIGCAVIAQLYCEIPVYNWPLTSRISQKLSVNF
jgi:hypothetical protein